MLAIVGWKKSPKRGTRGQLLSVLAERVHANIHLLFRVEYYFTCDLFGFGYFVFSIINVAMCGSSDDDVLKTRTHELILFNVTYENIKISYSFMVTYLRSCSKKCFKENGSD